MIDHRSHDYPNLLQRWRAVARAAGLKLEPFAEAGGYELFHLRTPALQATGGIYISAGIHGDEAASTEGLLAWAQKHAHDLATWPLQIFPCLNPWGLVRNVRTNEQGIDLNRAFSRRQIPEIRGLHTVVGRRRFAAALHLHEDYDAQGIYLYEIRDNPPHWGEPLIAAAQKIIPADPRARIEDRVSRLGIIRRRLDSLHIRRIGGLPEAIFFYRRGTPHCITFETPSEFALEIRIQAHVAVLDETLRLLGHSS